ncbi:hypothetical protein AGLY_001695 [Aphis glycines]|uniref:CGG triplet repeat-binding protein 1 n=1 Tax=Aphis glycines TaxID=307491 RepID=A0A6G0U706_APHGL|nr:hypothetical protein AGLY_001695 [Aphis glycines]
MPKVRVSKARKAKNYVLEFPNKHFQTDGEILYCSACEKSVSIEQRFLVVQHIGTAKHKESKIRRQKFKPQFFASTTSSGNKNLFISELCRAFIHADIPISKLENKSLNAFLTKYTGQLNPDENGLIWVSIDETVDVEGRHFGNVIVGKLSETFSKSFLLNCAQLEKCNHKTIAKLFNDSMSLLWPKAPYMVKSAVAINVFYPKMIHLTCLARGLHRIGETIRAKFYKVDKLIAELMPTIGT